MSDQNAIKIVVDTNLWISFCIGTKLSFLTDAIITKKVTICFSDELYSEIFSVLKRPKIQAKIKEGRIKDLHNILEHRINYINPQNHINDCRDPKDNFLLELALAANASYLVTGDIDLLVLDPYNNVRIIKASEFEKIL
jgi:putative PIN family toxin of toxin-antitoxin system